MWWGHEKPDHCYVYQCFVLFCVQTEQLELRLYPWSVELEVLGWRNTFPVGYRHSLTPLYGL